MLKGLWTIGVKVPDLEKELEFQRAMGNEIVLDEKLPLGDESYRIPLVKMGDKYLHIGEKMVYETVLDESLPYGPVHLVYATDDFDAAVRTCLAAGATQFHEPVEVSAGFGDRKVGFFRSPSGWIFEIIQIHHNAVPEVV